MVEISFFDYLKLLFQHYLLFFVKKWLFIYFFENVTTEVTAMVSGQIENSPRKEE